ncbi:hypothetical protein NDU88_011953 [Pleurodeles waltl]|uniref:Uncharacterized protein n=1 Tax=Pleurodeles waltl TaxID=8319 RepID=A0AAV7S3A2_PLEWA|nr:hypothetical protein NDU88_011953 [Pleurodeles waltl]
MRIALRWLLNRAAAVIIWWPILLRGRRPPAGKTPQLSLPGTDGEDQSPDPAEELSGARKIHGLESAVRRSRRYQKRRGPGSGADFTGAAPGAETGVPSCSSSFFPPPLPGGRRAGPDPGSREAEAPAKDGTSERLEVACT